MGDLPRGRLAIATQPRALAAALLLGTVRACATARQPFWSPRRLLALARTRSPCRSLLRWCSVSSVAPLLALASSAPPPRLLLRGGLPFLAPLRSWALFPLPLDPVALLSFPLFSFAPTRLTSVYGFVYFQCMEQIFWPLCSSKA